MLSSDKDNGSDVASMVQRTAAVHDVLGYASGEPLCWQTRRTFVGVTSVKSQTRPTFVGITPVVSHCDGRRDVLSWGLLRWRATVLAVLATVLHEDSLFTQARRTVLTRLLHEELYVAHETGHALTY